MKTLNMKLKAPFPYFGGKSRVASLIWERFGDVRNYIEPFGGSLAVLLGRPLPFCGTETVNDINGWLQNAWRAIQADPDAVAAYADNPVMELDLHARGDAIFYRGWTTAAGERLMPEEFVERMRSDEEWYDPKCAGWWIWGQSSWIGDNWGRSRNNARKDDNGEHCGVTLALPHLGNLGQGVNRKRPHLGGGKGVNRQLPHLGCGAREGDQPGVTSRRYDLIEYMRKLSERLRMVRVCCGDWKRVCGETPTVKLGLTAIFFDPPYAVQDRDYIYGEHEDYDVAHEVRDYCIEYGDNKLMRICLAGYEEHDELEKHGWTSVKWKTNGGYANQSSRGNENRKRETLWFSPNCINDERSLFQ